MSMGLYIKGMEMPKYGCDHCFLRTGNYCGRIEKNESVVEYARKSERHPDCPLVPVPPHGKLIDADAILQEATKGEEPFDWIDKNELLRLFFDAPTIIPYEQSQNEPTEDDLLEFEAEALGYRRFGMAEEGET